MTWKLTSYILPYRKRITVLSFFFAFVIVMGAVMVAQPTFIFGVERVEHKDTYALGVTLALIVAALSGWSRVLIAKCARQAKSSSIACNSFKCLADLVG